MSWLTDQLERSHGKRPYPVADLAVALGIAASDPRLTSKLALALGLNTGWVRRCRRLGLNDTQADEWATKAGIHAGDVWPRWFDGLRGAALVNANRSTCPRGHPYDARDSRGYRVCRICTRERVAALRKKSANPQVAALVTGELIDPCCDSYECTGHHQEAM